MRFSGARLAVLAAMLVALATAGSAAAQENERGIDPNQGRSLVEVNVPDRAAAIELQLDADKYGIDFNDHYLRTNANGSVTVTVFGNADELAALEAAGYELGTTIEGPATWNQRAKDWQADVKAEKTAEAAVLAPASADVAPRGDIVVLRVDYFENYAGRFLSVEAKDGTRGSSTTGESLVVAWNTGAGTPIDQGPRTMNVNIDPDTTPDTYIEHRILIKVGELGSATPPAPTRIRIGSSNGTFVEADVNTWLGGGLPPMSSNFLSNFTTRYLDPTELYGRFRELAAEFPDLTTIIPLPYKTNGYQRRAQALMAGLTNPAFTGNLSATVGGQAVILTSRAWGHEGGNDLTAEFVNPGVANAPLTVSFNGTDLSVGLATGATGALTSTAAQVAAAINAHAGAAATLVAQTYRGNVGAGIVQARPKGNLSDFLTTATNAHVQRGPFQYFVLRIGKNRPGNSDDQGVNGRRVGVFLYCQQHAREWATPLTCLETAEELLRNYGIDKTTRKLVDRARHLHPAVVEPGRGALLDAQLRPAAAEHDELVHVRRCCDRRRERGQLLDAAAESDPGRCSRPVQRLGGPECLGCRPESATTRSPRSSTATSARRTRASATSSPGPSEASEPEIKNELWIADTFKNIKFSNNIHSFGGYFMWAPGAYLPDRGEGDAVHANIGVEKYFFEAGDRILNRIKEVRNTAILPERTGPIADVLYSAAGNSADEHWYNRGVIAYSFETGADRFGALEQTTLSIAAPAGATGIRVGNRNLFTALEKVTIDPGLPTEETRTVQSVTAANPRARPPTSSWASRSSSRTRRTRSFADRTRRRPASASSRTMRPRAGSKRSSSQPETTGCSSRPTTTRRTTRAPR
jgi:hypothetical protein